MTFLVHGGAGALSKNLKEGESLEKRYRKELSYASSLGFKLLKKGHQAEEAVESAITYLEDCELFNAGRGSALNHQGEVQMDAGLATGDGAYGGIGLIREVKNPIKLARLVKNKCPHLYLFGEGAIQFAKDEKLEIMTASYFKTEKTISDWKKAYENGGIFLEEVTEEDALGEKTASKKMGTVGAVAFDKEGRLASGTSTGGLSNKWVGRVGDSPIFGAGTFASNETMALSATGKGEEIIKSLFASQVHLMMKLKKKNLCQSLETMVKKVMPINSVGAIAIDHLGRPALSCNTEGMFSALVMSSQKVRMGRPLVMIFQEEVKKAKSFFNPN